MQPEPDSEPFPRVAPPQARKSVPDASGRVRCLGCGKAFAAHAQLAQHLADAHFGKNAPEAARGSRAPSAPLMLSDLLVRSLNQACLQKPQRVLSGTLARLGRDDRKLHRYF